MAETTLATAKKCPKCNNVGDLISKQPTEVPELTGYVFQCMNKVCPWFNTRWVVTADEDDKVPVRDIGHDPKRFPARAVITEEQRERMRTKFDDETT